MDSKNQNPRVESIRSYFKDCSVIINKWLNPVLSLDRSVLKIVKSSFLLIIFTEEEKLQIIERAKNRGRLNLTLYEAGILLRLPNPIFSNEEIKKVEIVNEWIESIMFTGAPLKWQQKEVLRELLTFGIELSLNRYGQKLNSNEHSLLLVLCDMVITQFSIP